MEYKYKIGVIRSDMGGCFQLRVYQPFSELKRFGVDYQHTCFLPQTITEPREDTLVRWVEQFDMIIVQRCFRYDVFQQIRRACTIASRKLVFETDDDYINLPPYNPCSEEMKVPGALEGFVQILRESDHITVTTQELKDIYYRFNQNITVLPNNVESVNLFKDIYAQKLPENGKIEGMNLYGFCSYPSFVEIPSHTPVAKPKLEKLIKVGYTATPTHREDFKTIYKAWEKLLSKYPNVVVFYMGDDWFAHNHPSCHKNVVHIPNMPYELYLMNIRNFDIGIAPLTPDVFNMSKSPLKLLEYASWGVPAVAPNFITYNREFTDGQNALLYHDGGKQFFDNMELMINDHKLREQLGFNAAKHVHENRTEKVNAHERFALYEQIIENTPRFMRFRPNKQLEIVNA